MTSPLLRTAGLAVAGLALLSACSGGRPAVADLETGLTSNASIFPVAEQQAECAAELLLDSDLSDEVLTVVAEADQEAEADLSAEDRSMLATLQVQVLQTCTG
ncbi:hypothetical protein [Aeromicrobium sp. Leaf350]|uniref:hypothetical protein n=1 Tax=Aeromicrobium sp. Leaf350 TaxID=2876565 RepID=UPI001E394589|nr:hypothetical protein [Aeromicrobium sp. Leaf350]